jgi:hypothetical protein
MIRPKRKAAPTVFIDNGIVPDDASHDDKSLSNEDELLKDTYSDVSGEDNNTEEDSDVDEVPVKVASIKHIKEVAKKGITKKEVTKNIVKNSPTTKAESTVSSACNAEPKSLKGNKTTKTVKSNNTNDVIEEVEKPVKNIKSTRKFKLLPETIIAQNSTPKVNVKLVKKIEYETSTPIQCARQIAPIIYAAKITSGKSSKNDVLSTFRYIFTIQEVTSPSNPKSFSYICESIVTSNDEGKSDVKHLIKPQTKTTKKAETIAKNAENVSVVNSSITKEKRESENLPVIEKKSVPTRTNVKKLTPAKKKEVKK